MAKQRKNLTLMVLPEDGGQVNKYILTPRKQTWLRRVIVGSLVGFVALAGYAGYSLQYIPSYFSLRERVALQKEALIATNHRLEILQGQLDRVKVFEQKLRVVLGHSQSSGDSEYVGIGGPNEGDLLGSVSEDDREIAEELSAGLSNIAIDASLVELGIHDLHNLLGDQSSLLASTPSLWPVHGWVTSKFGRRMSPFTGLPSMHHGIDVAARHGAPIVAPADGIVTFAATSRGYGNVLVIDHGYDLVTRYGHLSGFEVRAGEKIRRGDVIARVGNTGRSTAPHLHYEVRLNSVPVDPMKYILLD